MALLRRVLLSRRVCTDLGSELARCGPSTNLRSGNGGQRGRFRSAGLLAIYGVFCDTGRFRVGLCAAPDFPMPKVVPHYDGRWRP